MWVWVIKIKSARLIWASITAGSEVAKSFRFTSGRGSEGNTESFGVLVFKRVKYGSTRTTVLPSVISHPAVPKYASFRPVCAGVTAEDPTRRRRRKKAEPGTASIFAPRLGQEMTDASIIRIKAILETGY